MVRAKVDEDKMLHAVSLVKSGVHVKDACRTAGIGRTTWFNYGYRARELRKGVEQ